jgi:hypothetical protein
MGYMIFTGNPHLKMSSLSNDLWVEVLSWHFDRQDLGKARGISKTFGIRDLESGNRNEVFRKGAVLIIPH